MAYQGPSALTWRPWLTKEVVKGFIHCKSKSLRGRNITTGQAYTESIELSQSSKMYYFCNLCLPVTTLVVRKVVTLTSVAYSHSRVVICTTLMFYICYMVVKRVVTLTIYRKASGIMLHFFECTGAFK